MKLKPFTHSLTARAHRAAVAYSFSRKWNPIFAWILMESALYRKRSFYNQAIADVRKANDSRVHRIHTFACYEIIVEQAKHQVKYQVDLTDMQIAVLSVLGNKALSRKEILP